MATANGQSPTDLKDRLLSHGHQFAFFQAMRLLTGLAPERDLQILPHLSLGFPASDVVRIEERPNDKGFSLTTTFLGLYGVSSPLPAFYSEDLFRDDSTATRDFLDIFHQPLFALLFKSWKKYRLFFQMSEANNAVPLQMLYALCGLSQTAAPGEDPAADYAMIRYAGLLGSHPRSALGLSTILTDFLGGIAVDVIPFMPRAVKIPQDQRLHLGSAQNVLGQDSFVGEEFIDRQGKFRVRIGPLSRQRFRPLLQGGAEHRKMVDLITTYLTDPLDYDIELILSGEERKPTCLGVPEWSRLGLDTALLTGETAENMSVIFPPVEPEGRLAA